jgi:hypothetical protein
VPRHAETRTAAHPGIDIVLVAIVEVACRSGAARRFKAYDFREVLVRDVREPVTQVENLLPGRGFHERKDRNCYIIRMLGIEQKKGDDEKLCGRMIAYARILPTPEKDESDTPFDEMIKNGLLTLEGDFRKFNPTVPSRQKRNQVMDERLNELLETMEENGVELPENLDVETVRDRLHELSNMEVIPIPARIGNFSREEDILKEDADIYYVGEFIGANQAHFCLTTLPIYYQARYREQTKKHEMEILNDMLSQFENGQFLDNDDIMKDTVELFPEGASLTTFVGDLMNLLNAKVIPFLLACETDEEYDEQVKLLYNFMKSYPEQLDVKRIDASLRMLREDGNNRLARKVLELSCKKINALYNEDAKAAERFENEITSLKV